MIQSLMKHSLALVFFVLSVLLLASAQESASAAKESSIAGTVVEEPGSQPLKKVIWCKVSRLESFDQEGNRNCPSRFSLNSLK